MYIYIYIYIYLYLCIHINIILISIYIYIYIYIYINFQIDHKSRFNPVKDYREDTKLVALHKFKYICKIKAKTTKILKCIKALLKVFT